MPLRLVSPRKGKSPHWTIRGSYLGQRINRSAKTGKRVIAAKVLKGIERQIERGEFTEQDAPTFASAALAYMKAGGERTHMAPLLNHFGHMPLYKITQAAIDEAALELYPTVSPATRNRQVYTPISAMLKHAGVHQPLRRPKGSEGRKVTNWLWPDQAERLFDEAGKADAEFRVFLILLCYTGMRLSEALGLKVDNVRLADGVLFLARTKNTEPRSVYLPPYVVATLAGHPRGLERPGQRVFRFRKSGHLYSLLRAVAARAEVELPERSAFHIFRHTYATWMRRYAGLDTRGLVGTGAWKDPKSATRYEHVVVTEEARKAALLPTPKVGKL